MFRKKLRPASARRWRLVRLTANQIFLETAIRVKQMDHRMRVFVIQPDVQLFVALPVRNIVVLLSGDLGQQI
jgi:hypothetical protein